MLLCRRAKTQQEIKMDKSRDCNYFQFNYFSVIFAKSLRAPIL